MPKRHDQPFFLNTADVARAFDRAADGYDEAAVLAHTVRAQLTERLDLVAIDPAVIADMGVATGESLAPLAARYPAATLIGLDLSKAMLVRARRRAGGAHLVAADAHRLPLKDGAVQLLFSNLMLPWCHDTEAVLRECRRVLAPDALLTFSTYGPDTLGELRAAWARVDDATHVHFFYDMHDIGDALQRAGFAGPVMDVDRYTLTYPTSAALMADLKAVGGQNLAAGRPAGLTGRGKWAALCGAYERFRDAGRLPATYEVIYGHAFAAAAPAQTRLADGSVAVPVGPIRRAKSG